MLPMAVCATLAIFATPATGSEVRTQASPAAPCGPAARACLDVSTQQAWLMNHGAVTYGPVPVASGSARYPTPPGIFHVIYKNAHFWSTAFDAPMPYSVFFYDGMAFHQGSVHIKSHGCVHLRHVDAVKFFHTLRVGDEVQVVH